MSALLPLNLEHIIPIISAWLYTMLRVSSFFLATPLFSQLAIPAYIRIILSIVISIILTPQFISTTTLPNLYSTAGIITVFQQLIIGIGMGLILQMTFEILNLAGQFIATSMQLNFAVAFSPLQHTQINVLGNLYQLLGMLIFVSAHGPLILIGLLEKSFETLPISTHLISLPQLKAIPLWGGQMFAYSLSLALPVMATLFIINIALAIMTRLAPALNIFSIGFPVTILAGLITLIFSLPFSLDRFADILHHAYDFVSHWQRLQ